MRMSVFKVFCVTLVVMVAVCFTVEGQNAKEPIKIACVFNQTGIGWDSERGACWAMHLAADEFNKVGGVLGRKVECIDIDLGYTNEDVIKAYKKAASYNVNAIIGGTEAGEEDAAAEMRRDLGIPQVVLYACSGKLVQPGYFYGGFHTNIYPNQFDSPIVDLVTKSGAKKIAIIMDDCGYGRLNVDILQKLFANSSVKIVDIEWFSYSAMFEIGPQVRKALSYHPDALHVGMWNEAGAVGMAKVIKELDWKGLLTLDCGCLSDAYVRAVTGAGESPEGWYGIRTWMPVSTISESMEFEKKFRAWHETGGVGAWDYASGGYIAMKSMLMAMQTAGTADDRLKIADAMYKENWVTPYGKPVLWLPGGQFYAPWTALGVVKNGEIVSGVVTELPIEKYNEPYRWTDAYKEGMNVYMTKYRK